MYNLQIFLVLLIFGVVCTVLGWELKNQCDEYKALKFENSKPYRTFKCSYCDKTFNTAYEGGVIANDPACGDCFEYKYLKGADDDDGRN